MKIVLISTINGTEIVKDPEIAVFDLQNRKSTPYVDLCIQEVLSIHFTNLIQPAIHIIAKRQKIYEVISMKNLKNTEKINKKFAPTLTLLDEYVGTHKIISKLVVFGPTIMNEAYINSDEAEIYLAVYFDEKLNYTHNEYSRETCHLENEIPYVLTYAVQNEFKYMKDGQLTEDVKMGIVIYDSKG